MRAAIWRMRVELPSSTHLPTAAMSPAAMACDRLASSSRARTRDRAAAATRPARESPGQPVRPPRERIYETGSRTTTSSGPLLVRARPARQPSYLTHEGRPSGHGGRPALLAPACHALVPTATESQVIGQPRRPTRPCARALGSGPSGGRLACGPRPPGPRVADRQQASTDGAQFLFTPRERVVTGPSLLMPIARGEPDAALGKKRRPPRRAQ